MSDLISVVLNSWRSSYIPTVYSFTLGAKQRSCSASILYKLFSFRKDKILRAIDLPGISSQGNFTKQQRNFKKIF